MEQDHNYIIKNKASWNSKVAAHVQSEFYDNASFLQGRNTLNSIELNLLGDVKGKSVLHLQCHFGQDSLSLARMGAQVTGVDFSEEAIQTARDFNTQIGTQAQFICCDIYDLPNHLKQQFDIVFTSYGTIGWLPDLQKWASVVSQFLKPGGHFIMADFHPIVWMMDNHFNHIAYSYFNTEEIIETETGTYADREAPITNETVSWNHPTSELLNNLIQQGISIQRFDEYDYSPYNCFQETEEFEPGKFRIKHLLNKIPMVYSILGLKK